MISIEEAIKAFQEFAKIAYEVTGGFLNGSYSETRDWT